MQIKAMLKTPFYSGNVKALKGGLNCFNTKNSEYSGLQIVAVSVSVNNRIFFHEFAWFFNLLFWNSFLLKYLSCFDSYMFLKVNVFSFALRNRS